MHVLRVMFRIVCKFVYFVVSNCIANVVKCAVFKSPCENFVKSNVVDKMAVCNDANALL